MKLAIVGLVLMFCAQVAFSHTPPQTRKPAKEAVKYDSPKGDTSSGEDKGNTKKLASLAQQLNEANRSFTYRGQPINPLALMDLIETFSDGSIGPVAIDLSGTYKSDRYYGEYQTKSDGAVFMDLKTSNPSFKEGDAGPGFIAYKRLGTLKGNLHVIEIKDTTSLREVTRNLLLIRFNIDYEYKEDGSRRNRLVMQRLGTISLGEELNGQVKVQTRGNSIRISGNSILVGGKSGYRKPSPDKVIVIK